jgi:hypothetical protein
MAGIAAKLSTRSARILEVIPIIIRVFLDFLSPSRQYLD